MKKQMCVMLAMTLFSFQSFAACEWSTGIHLLPDSNYEYSRECHVRVGETVRDLSIEIKKTELLTSAIKLKDVAISKSDERADMWMKTSQDLEKRVETLDRMNSQTKWIYFGLGFLAASAAVYGASKLVNR